MFFFTSFVLCTVVANALATSSEYTTDVQATRTCYCQCPCDGGTSDVDVRRLKRASKYDKPAENLCYCQCGCDKVDAGLVSSYIIEDVEQSNVEGSSSSNTGTGTGTGGTGTVTGTDVSQSTVPIKDTLNADKILYMDISAKGNEVWAVFCNNTVVRGQMSASGEFQSWKAVPLTGIPAGQKVIAVGAVPDGNSFVVTNVYDNNVYVYNSGTTSWRANGGTADQVSSCGPDCVIGINRNNDGVWSLGYLRYSGMTASGLMKGNWAAAGLDTSRWIVDTRGKIKRCVITAEQAVQLNWPTWCSSNTIWEVMCPKSAATVEVQNKDRAVMTTKTGEIFLWDGKSWNQVPFNGKATRAAVTDKWVYFLNQKGNAFFANV